MQFRKIIQSRIHKTARGIDLQGDLNAAIAANVGEPGQTTHVSSRSTAVSAQAKRDEGETDRDKQEKRH